MPAAHRELKEVLERPILEMPRPGDRSGASQELGHSFNLNSVDWRLQPDGTAEGSQDLLGRVAPLAEGSAEGHVVRHQVVDVHCRTSRETSPTARRAARSTLA